MIPLFVRISGFGPHVDTRIPWEDVSPVAVLSAPNGSGKTFLLEAPFACLYGEFPSRPGSLYDHLTMGGTNEGLIDVAFLHNGKKYAAERKIRKTAKTTSQEAALYCEGEQVAGPKVTDFERAVEALLGDKKTAAATWFSAQGGKGDLCACPASERREVFAQLLNLKDLDKLAEGFRDHAAKEETKAEAIEGRVSEKPEQWSAQIEQARERLAGMQQAETDTRTALGVAEREVESCKAKLAGIDANDADLRRAVEEHRKAAEKHDLMLVEVSRAAQEVQRLEQKAAGYDAAKDAKEQAEKVRETIERLEENRRDKVAWDTWWSMLNHLGHKLDSARKMLEVGRPPEPSEELIATAANVEALREQYKQARADNEKARAHNETLRQERERIVAEDKSLRAELKRLEERQARKPQTPGAPEACAVCPLLREYSGLGAEIERVNKALIDNQLKMAALPEPMEERDLSDLLQRGTKAGEAERQVTEMRERLAGYEELIAGTKKDIANLEQGIEEHKAAEPKRPEFAVAVIDVALDAEKKKLRELEAKAMQLSGIEEARTALEAAKFRQQQANEAADKALEKMRDLAGPAEAAERALTDRNAVRERATCDLSRAEDRAKLYRHELEQVLTKRGATEQSITDMERRKAEAEAALAEAQEIRKAAARLRTLQTAFGKKGVQPILIDAAAPALETIAAGLLQQMTGGKMALRFATQAARKDGSIAEDFLILARDARGERDVNTFSGGEKRLLQTVLRLAVMMWVGGMFGKRAECLLVDETFDALDGDNARALAETLKGLSDRFARIVVITHDEQIARMLGTSIRLRKTLSGVEVEVGS
jgi:DNA repair exonuclease SbcCD ATPase subunit